MGADFLCNYVVFGENEDLVEAKNRLLSAVGKITMDDKQDILCYYEDVYGETIKEFHIEKIKTEFCAVIENVFERITKRFRDISFITRKGEIIYVTGGMSWGDDPTESFSAFSKFLSLPQKILKVGGAE